MTRIGQAVYLARIDRGLSQKELSSRTGISQPNISSIEKGRDFQVSTLYKLAAALDLTPSDLITGIKPINVNKNQLFQRHNIENLVNTLPDKQKNASFDQVAENLRITLSDKSSIKDLHLSWMKLKKTFSQDELNAIFSRLDKASDRKASGAVPTGNR